MMLPGLNKLGILIDFQIRQDFIAEVLCINKEKPITVCHGQCYLSDQLQQAEEQQAESTPTRSIETLEVLYVLAKNSIGLSDRPASLVSNLKVGYRDVFYGYCFPAEIFHPPQG